MASQKNISLKQMQKRILKLKNLMVRNISTITGAVSKMVVGVNSVLNSLLDVDSLRNISIGVEKPVSHSLSEPDISGEGKNMGDKMKAELLKSFKTVPKDFVYLGQNAVSTFEKGFLSDLQSVMNNIKTAIDFKIDAICKDGQKKLGEGLSTTTYNSSYNFYSSAMTVSQQIEQARQSELLKQLRS